jgi:hypothetical protein
LGNHERCCGAGPRDREGRATMTKQLEVQIAPDDLEFLKTNQYLLCFAKIP